TAALSHDHCQGLRNADELDVGTLTDQIPVNLQVYWFFRVNAHLRDVVGADEMTATLTSLAVQRLPQVVEHPEEAELAQREDAESGVERALRVQPDGAGAEVRPRVGVGDERGADDLRLPAGQLEPEGVPAVRR